MRWNASQLFGDLAEILAFKFPSENVLLLLLLLLLGYLKDSNAAAHSVDIKRVENDIECVQFACWIVIITISLKNKSWERCLENDQMVINSGFPTVNCRK